MFVGFFLCCFFYHQVIITLFLLPHLQHTYIYFVKIFNKSGDGWFFEVKVICLFFYEIFCRRENYFWPRCLEC